jgi:mono/diheme cytochrome c family protein
MKNFLLGIIFTVVVLFLGGFLVVKQGYVSIEADQPPSALEKKIATSAVDASVDRHAPDQKNPTQPTDENLVAGATIYLNHCAGCHGLPSNPDSQFGRSFYPPVPQFFREAPDMPDNQNFYIAQHGTRWTGMPAWSKTLSEQQIWTVVTFLSRIDKLPPAALKVFEPPALVPAPGVATAPLSR